jgi:hypothetical protein
VGKIDKITVENACDLMDSEISGGIMQPRCAMPVIL